ncbi:MAG TPA: hypothetical protein VF614_00785 [Chthoniobacteraceae bacterium]|jgi:hypothetical protein
MTNNSFALPFADRDLQLFPPEDVALQLRVSRAFVRLCLSAGCPTRGHRLSAAELLHWLFENYDKVRLLCGFRGFASVSGVKPVAKVRLKMANAVLTLLEFSASRSSNLDEKQQIECVAALVGIAADRG